MRYVIAIDGIGDHDGDFTVLVVEAESADAAVERVISPPMSYGREADGVAYVAALDDVRIFTVNDSRRRVAAETTFEDVIEQMPETLRQYTDIDGGHGA